MPSIKYSMTNTVNGEAIKIRGSGSLNRRGKMALSLQIDKVPKNWSPIIVPCICSGHGPGPIENDELVGGLLHAAPNGYQTAPGTLRRATLFDASGEEIAAVTATGIYKQTKSGLDFSIQVDTKTKASTIWEALQLIDHYSFTIFPEGPGR